MLTIDDIRAAQERIDGAIIRTPLVHSPRLSTLTGADVFVKLENLQATGAFKERGALNRLLTLSDSERARGVIAMSAGNHAQAVAWHARRLGIAATIVMPATTPFVKVANTEAMGATVLLEGETVAECRARVKSLVTEAGYMEIHPFDDPLIMAGQGTAALEMLADQPNLNAVIVPIGGGGLISGMATAAKAIAPDCTVYGVQAQNYASMVAALKGGETVIGGDTLAEGIAVKGVSAAATDIVRRLVKDILLIDEAQIETAIYAYMAGMKMMAEGAGAAALAAVLANKDLFAGKRVGLILCGGNIDPRMLAAIAMRALEREHRIVDMRIIARDRPGILGTITSLVGTLGGNILDVRHRRDAIDVPAMAVSVDLTVETRDQRHAERIAATLIEHGMTVRRLLAEAHTAS